LGVAGSGIPELLVTSFPEAFQACYGAASFGKKSVDGNSAALGQGLIRVSGINDNYPMEGNVANNSHQVCYPQTLFYGPAPLGGVAFAFGEGAGHGGLGWAAVPGQSVVRSEAHDQVGNVGPGSGDGNPKFIA